MTTARADLGQPAWRKSRRSGQEGNCVELASVGETVAVRNSRHPYGAVLAFEAADMSGFFASIKAGELDDLA